jgi:hypothetical protein
MRRKALLKLSWALKFVFKAITRKYIITIINKLITNWINRKPLSSFKVLKERLKGNILLQFLFSLNNMKTKNKGKEYLIILLPRYKKK